MGLGASQAESCGGRDAGVVSTGVYSTQLQGGTAAYSDTQTHTHARTVAHTKCYLEERGPVNQTMTKRQASTLNPQVCVKAYSTSSADVHTHTQWETLT